MSTPTRSYSTEATRARARGGRLYPVLVPPPGSDAAFVAGCECPPDDNLHGEFLPPRGWVLDLDCPLHAGDVQWCARRGIAPRLHPTKGLRWVA